VNRFWIPKPHWRHLVHRRAMALAFMELLPSPAADLIGRAPHRFGNGKAAAQRA
jgi:hypothetical protein